MKSYLLDTNCVSNYFNNHPNVIARVTRLTKEQLFVSVITFGEMNFGHERTKTTNQARRDEFAEFIKFHFPLPITVTRHTSSHYGILKANVFSQFPPDSNRHNHPETLVDKTTGAELGIDENDLWIAAQAMEHNFILASTDRMNKIKKAGGKALEIEDWTLPLTPSWPN
jgi:tRNA(fMet)-specific endonuclease VapC